MILQGLTLMITGMTTVFLFLLLMMVTIQLVAHLTRGAAERELAELAEEQRKRAARRKKPAADGVPVAVLAAAVAAFEQDRARP